MLHVASVCTPPACFACYGSCCAKFETDQQLPTFRLFRDHRSVAQQCWSRLHSSSNIVGATHARYTWSPNSYVLHPSHVALQEPTLLGVVAFIYSPLPTRTQQLPTLLVQQSEELLRVFAKMYGCPDQRNPQAQSTARAIKPSSI